MAAILLVVHFGGLDGSGAVQVSSSNILLGGVRVRPGGGGGGLW